MKRYTICQPPEIHYSRLYMPPIRFMTVKSHKVAIKWGRYFTGVKQSHEIFRCEVASLEEWVLHVIYYKPVIAQEAVHRVIGEEGDVRRIVQ